MSEWVSMRIIQGTEWDLINNKKNIIFYFQIHRTMSDIYFYDN